jgi:hypothetical protein
VEYILLILLALAVLVFVSRKHIASAGKPPKLSPGAENAQLIKALLDLDPDSLAELWRLYQDQFGAGPARYARQTYMRWKAGEVRPNKQTFRRFLVHLPKVMSFELKCELLRELRESYCPREHSEATVYVDDWKETLGPLVDSLVNRSNMTLPAKVSDRLSWLAEDDMQVADALLQQSERRQALITLTMLEQEFTNIERLLDNAAGTKTVKHVVRLPQGSIELNIKRR